MDRGQWIVAGAVLMVAGLAGWWFGAAPAPPPPIRMEVSTSSDAITVHVAGAVAAPGLVELSADSRVADAVDRAGGLLATADASSLNLAAPVADGQQVVVRAIGEPAAPVGSGQVRLNTATAEDLEAISGVGPVLAARIVEHRAANGPFVALEDLLDVAGIGESKLAALRGDLVVP